jgi:hypothetical protein
MLAHLGFTRWDDKMTLPRKEEGCYMFMMTFSDVHLKLIYGFSRRTTQRLEKIKGEKIHVLLELVHPN